ncbi:MAG: hypothetical protein RLN76_06565 [Phycisphaeraceae bacterium]
MKTVIILLLTSALLLLPGCMDFTPAIQASERAIAQFHQQYNKMQFDEIHDGAHYQYQRASTKSEHNRLLTDVHQNLGLVVSTQNTGHGVISTTDLGTFIAFRQETTFQYGNAIEEFVFYFNEPITLLSGYHFTITSITPPSAVIQSSIH